jgi:hypothetical protein
MKYRLILFPLLIISCVGSQNSSNNSIFEINDLNKITYYDKIYESYIDIIDNNIIEKSRKLYSIIYYNFRNDIIKLEMVSEKENGNIVPWYSSSCNYEYDKNNRIIIANVIDNTKQISIEKCKFYLDENDNIIKSELFNNKGELMSTAYAKYNNFGKIISEEIIFSNNNDTISSEYIYNDLYLIEYIHKRNGNLWNRYKILSTDSNGKIVEELWYNYSSTGEESINILYYHEYHYVD